MTLLVLDLEGTLFETQVRLPGTNIDSTIWQGIASALGADAIAEEVATHVRWEAGEYGSYLDWMRDTVEIHQRYGLREPLFASLIQGARYQPGVADALRSLDRSKFIPMIVSGGFRELAARAQRDLRISHAFAACEYLFDDQGSLAEYNLLPCDFHGKLSFVQLMLEEYRIDERDWVFVGDGVNDIPIASAAPVSIAYRGHPGLRAVATHSIDDFAALPQLLSGLSSAVR